MNQTLIQLIPFHLTGMVLMAILLLRIQTRSYEWPVLLIASFIWPIMLIFAFLPDTLHEWLNKKVDALVAAVDRLSERCK